MKTANIDSDENVAAEPATITRPREDDLTSSRDAQILIVDDESANFMVLRKVLSDHGYSRIITTSDSTTALQTMQQIRPDLVLLDVMMPVVDGIELLTKMRIDPTLTTTPVIVLTASEDPIVEEQVRGLGIAGFLRKPVTPADLVTHVHSSLTSDPPDRGTDAVSPQAAAAPVADVPSSRTEECSIRNSRIVIVDDEPFNFMVLRKFLSDEGYARIETTSDSTTAVETIRQAQPDLVIPDVVMPVVDGIEILTILKADPQLAHIPVLILTASSDAQIKKNALDIGATDFLNKPVDSNDLLPRVRNSIMGKLQQDQLRDYAGQLEDQVRLRTLELIESRRDIVRCLARAGEYRDSQTGYHVLRVGLYAGLLAEELGFSAPEVEDLELAAQLHDVGKIAIPDAILKKPGRLTDIEKQAMEQHCYIGTIIIDPDSTGSVERLQRDRGANLNRLMQMASVIAATHHERWDGTGYPAGLQGEQIPIEGRITAVADVFDALSSARPYKDAIDFDECVQMMEEDRGKHFDPQVLDAFLARKQDLIEVRLRHND